jgi:hypothetical protein
MTALYQLSYATTAFQNYQICFTRNLPERLFPNEAKIFFKEDKIFLLQSHSGGAFYTANKKRESFTFPFSFSFIPLE